jgi:hypothetical protein
VLDRRFVERIAVLHYARSHVLYSARIMNPLVATRTKQRVRGSNNCPVDLENRRVAWRHLAIWREIFTSAEVERRSETLGLDRMQVHRHRGSRHRDAGLSSAEQRTTFGTSSFRLKFLKEHVDFRRIVNVF